MDYVASHLSESMEEIFSGCNTAIRNTRGVAMGIAVIDQEAKTLVFGGVGNTRIVVVRNDSAVDHSEKIVRMTSSYGIVGAGYRRLITETEKFRPGDLVIMSTDGVTEMFDLSAYGDGMKAAPDKLARRIIEDWGLERDDAAVLVCLSNK
jgi:serine phosphatase RsbU (regulator of sigma subunit)